MTPDASIGVARAILKAGVPSIFAAMVAAAVAGVTLRERLTAIAILLEGAERGLWKPDAVSAALEQRRSEVQ